MLKFWCVCRTQEEYEIPKAKDPNYISPRILGHGGGFDACGGPPSSMPSGPAPHTVNPAGPMEVDQTAVRTDASGAEPPSHVNHVDLLSQQVGAADGIAGQEQRVSEPLTAHAPASQRFYVAASQEEILNRTCEDGDEERKAARSRSPNGIPWLVRTTRGTGGHARILRTWPQHISWSSYSSRPSALRVT